MTYSIPFEFEKYGRIEVEADSLDEAFKAAEKELVYITEAEMDANSSYLEDSLEIDYEGLVLDEDGEVVQEVTKDYE